jgi:LmbE family N-acetylglucosaminyl deacetylase
MNPYLQFVSEVARLSAQGRSLPLGGFAPPPRPAVATGAPRALIFSPHPDDECIIGALPLRLRCSGRFRVVNVAVTQGSQKARQAGRWQELQAACAYLGFDLVSTRPNGLEGVNANTRGADPKGWAAMVETIRALLVEQQPRVIFCPHAEDWNTTHIGTHWLVQDALRACGPGFACETVATEYWGAMKDPNLMVESSAEDVAELVAGTSFHAGEVRRNPFHALLPAWMLDNVRRGGELVGGQGEAAPAFGFATLYRLGRWRDGMAVTRTDHARFMAAAADPAAWF